VLDDDSIRTMASRVTWEVANVDDDPLAALLGVKVGGVTHTLEAGAFRGSLRNPANMDDVEDKFRRYSRHLIDASRQDEIVGMVRNLNGLSDVAELMSLVRP
jgi:hypothetical protein